MKTNKLIIAVLIIIQLLDIVLHAATDQLEIIRVTSNSIILLWLVVIARGKMNTKFSLISVGTYLLLNMIFLAREGITNAGQLRVTLFLLVLTTVVLSTSLVYLQDKHNS